MAKVHWLGATYQDVPAVSLPDGDGGESVFYEGGGGTLITKTITQNGTYNAEDDDADGYSEVTVNVSGGGEVAPNDVTFIDYDGTVLYSYTAAEALALTELPANPSHSGLTAQGWNYTLAEIKTEVNAVGRCVVGQMYVTDDGKTRLYISIPEDTPDNRLTFYVRFKSSKSNNCEINWGDGTVETKGSTSATNYSHTYQAPGDYLVTLEVKSGTISFIGSSSQTIYGESATSNAHNRARIRHVRIGANVTSIGTYTFYLCRAMTDITIPQSVTSIGTYAFSAERGLLYIVIPAGITSVSDYAFQNCNALQRVSMPPSLTSIGTNAFYVCTSLKTTAIPSTVTSIGSAAFQQCSSLETIVVPGGVTDINGNTFQQCSTARKITLKSGVQTIGASAFNNCVSLTELSLPSTIASIGNNAFQYCYDLPEIIIPSNATSLGSNAFNNCNSAKKISIPSGLTSIGSNALQLCYSLTDVDVPASVTTIGSAAFQECYGAGAYHFRRTTPPTLSNSNAFTSIASDCKIYVPYSADHSILNAYKTATNWSSQASKMVEEAAS